MNNKRKFLQVGYDDLEYINQCSREFEVIRKNLEIILDKMNELEGNSNDS